MRIAVNGEPRDLPDGATVADLVAALGVPPDGVAVAVDRQIVPRSRQSEHVLSEGDAVEVIRAVGGG